MNLTCNALSVASIEGGRLACCTKRSTHPPHRIISIVFEIFSRKLVQSAHVRGATLHDVFRVSSQSVQANSRRPPGWMSSATSSCSDARSVLDPVSEGNVYSLSRTMMLFRFPDSPKRWTDFKPNFQKVTRYGSSRSSSHQCIL